MLSRVQFEDRFVISRNEGPKDVAVRGSVVGSVWEVAGGFAWRVGDKQGIERSFRLARHAAFDAAYDLEVADKW